MLPHLRAAAAERKLPKSALPFAFVESTVTLQDPTKDSYAMEHCRDTLCLGSSPSQCTNSVCPQGLLVFVSQTVAPPALIPTYCTAEGLPKPCSIWHESLPFKRCAPEVGSQIPLNSPRAAFWIPANDH